MTNSHDENRPLRIVFAGTPDFASVALQALIDNGHDICAVYCQPDRRSGRGKKIQLGPVKQLALEHKIPVEQPINFIADEAVNVLANYQADLMIVVAYGLLLPKNVLETPLFGCINIHGSLLPRWRGAAPIQRAIEAGDVKTGITIMQMDIGLDTGNMLLKKSCSITSAETGSSLHDKLAELGASAINEYLVGFDLNSYQSNHGEKQDNSLANYAHKLSKDEAQIDWSDSMSRIERKIRAFNAWPVSFTHVGGKRLRVWQSKPGTTQSNQEAGKVVTLTKQGVEVVCGDQKTLLLTQLQPDGSKAMDAASLLNSKRDWFETNPILGSNS
jgi:methionyl-tRNA formyltransferase